MDCKNSILACLLFQILNTYYTLWFNFWWWEGAGYQLEELDINIGVIVGTSSSMVADDVFNDLNDGLVLVESIKLENMSDFISIDVSQSLMRYNQEVAVQSIYFLQHGNFQHQL